MLGEGLRMSLTGIFFTGRGLYYFPNQFDVLFDWVPLVVLGSLFIFSSLSEQRSKKGPMEL